MPSCSQGEGTSSEDPGYRTAWSRPTSSGGTLGREATPRRCSLRASHTRVPTGSLGRREEVKHGSVLEGFRLILDCKLNSPLGQPGRPVCPQPPSAGDHAHVRRGRVTSPRPLHSFRRGERSSRRGDAWFLECCLERPLGAGRPQPGPAGSANAGAAVN